MNYLCSYRPIIFSAHGRRAVQTYHLPPFIDGSCRREPDFQSPYPSISALCRAGLFAPRLRVGDRIAYITVKLSYLGVRPPHWRLAALLKVLHKFESHAQTAEWYISQGLSLPSNCLVTGNPPESFERTSGPLNPEFRRKTVSLPPDRITALWDKSYQERAAKWRVMLSCEPVFVDLVNPPIITVEMMMGIFNKVPSTLNPPRITSEEMDKLISLSRVG